MTGEVKFILKNGQSPASFCLFSFYSHDKYSTNLTIDDTSLDGVLGTQTWGADEFTKLWRHLK